MRWRWALDDDFDPIKGRSLTNEELEGLSANEKKELTRPPLNPNQTETLINTAIQLHSSAIDQEKQARWWVPIIIPPITTIIGILLGAWLKSH